MKKIGTFIVVLVLLLFIAIGSLTALALYYNRPLPNQGAVASFTVPKGSGVSTIAQRLESEGLIRSALFFRLLTRLLGTEGNLQAGIFSIPPAVSTLEIHDLFLSGKQVLVSVTIPEGYTISRIASLLEASEVVEADAFIAQARNEEFLEELGIPGASAEGYIYPDTYKFPKDFPADKTVAHLVDTFWTRLEEIHPEVSGMTRGMIHEKIVLASIIEREYRVSEEAPYIASVFQNRLNIGMPLQSCATVVYALTEEAGRPHPEYLTYRDLEIDSAYNTYQIGGLPPEPISNPGETALRSAFFPAESDYLYFVLQNPEDGKHFFSRSFNEHNQAKRLFIKER